MQESNNKPDIKNAWNLTVGQSNTLSKAVYSVKDDHETQSRRVV